MHVHIGYTALHRAACWGRVDCLRTLVANEADLQIKNIHGERAREVAARYENTSCVEFLDIAGEYNFYSYRLIMKFPVIKKYQNILI
jgi:ankyrin repeat protein